MYYMYMYIYIARMQELKYPTINYIQNAITKQITPLLEIEACQIQIKYGKLMVADSIQYRNLKEQSLQKIVVLNERLNFNACKMYKINSMASRRQVENVEKNCMKFCSSYQKESMIDIKFGREKLQKVVGEQQWNFSYKKSLLQKNKMINYLVNRSEFRLDFSQQQYQQNGDNYISQLGEKFPEKIRCLRFKLESKYNVSPYFTIKVVQVHQIDENIQKIGKQFYGIYRGQDSQKIDKFIMRYVPSQPYKTKQIKEEIELKFSEMGINKIMGLVKDRFELNKFVGDVIYDFRNLAEEKCPQLRSKETAKLQVQLKRAEREQEQDQQAEQVIQKISRINLGKGKGW